MFAFFLIVLAVVAALTVVGSRPSSADAIVSPLHHSRHLGSVEASRQAYSILPMR